MGPLGDVRHRVVRRNSDGADRRRRSFGVVVLRVLLPDHGLQVRVLPGQLLHHVLHPVPDLALVGQNPLPLLAVRLSAKKMFFF